MRKTTTVICATLVLFVVVGSKCDGNSGGGSGDTLTRIDSISFTGPTRITNGQSENYTVTVTRPDSTAAATAIVEIHGSGLGYDTVLARPTITFAANSETGTAPPFPLNCTPAGRVGKLAGPNGNSGHGSRECNQVGPAVICTDDAVSVTARFRESASSPISVVCKPSEGPTEGSTPPSLPAPTRPRIP